MDAWRKHARQVSAGLPAQNTHPIAKAQRQLHVQSLLVLTVYLAHAAQVTRQVSRLDESCQGQLIQRLTGLEGLLRSLRERATDPPGPVMIIRLASEADFAQWLPLSRGYQQFYKTEIPDATSATTWARFLNPVDPRPADAERSERGVDRGGLRRRFCA